MNLSQLVQRVKAMQDDDSPHFYGMPVEEDASMDEKYIKFRYPDGREVVFNGVTGKEVIEGEVVNEKSESV